MLPTLTERDIEEGMRSFIEREFPIATPAFRPDGRSLVDAYVESQGQFMKGPWLEIRRPFRTLPADMAALFPFLSGKYGVNASWVPYAHQKRAFKRLCFPDPKSTLIATGTGSGKTECFLLPVLDAVLRMNAQKIPGIKALVIYPMNALAADQARRFARMCREIAGHGGPQLSVGLYVGSPGEKSSSMRPEACITDREVLRANPPDVLLTNYKMLDFLLLRREDRALWRGTSAKSLRYLVVDELHTFDGAQGTDLACLVRRLRDFVGLGSELACVGTSATLGGGSDTLALRRYAEDVFGTDFSDEASVIREDRLSPAEYLETFETTRFEGQWPTPYAFRTSFKTIPKSADPESFMQGAFRLWFRYRSIPKGDRQSWERAALDLGRMLPKLEAFRRLMSEEDAVLSIDRLATDWRRDIEAVKGYTQEEAVLLIRSLVALISMARLGDEGRTRPFLTVRVELWVRELARMLATLEPRPRLIAEADRDDRTPPALPLVTCRDCNATGWGAVTGLDDSKKIDTSPEKFYTHFFAFEPDVAIFYPVDEKELPDVRKRFGKELRYINLRDPHGLVLEWVGEDLTDKEVLAKTKPNQEGRVERLLVRRPDIVKSTLTADGRDVRRSTACPCCGGENTLRLFGARAAPLASALFSHLTASTTNDDHKLIAFSDSVQDAAHRSGFIEARSYFYCVRQAAAGMVREVREGEAQTLEDLLLRLTDHWVDEVGEKSRLRQSREPEVLRRAEDIAAARFAATFVPSDMLWRAPWIDFVRGLSKPSGVPYGEVPALFEDEAQKTPTPWGRFVEDVKARLRWEVFVEFTFRARSGRSLEMAGIGAVVPDLGLVREAAPRLREKVVERVGGLRDTPPEAFERFITGFLEHQKSRGAFDLSGVEGLEDFMRFVETGDDFQYFNRSLKLPTYGKKFRPPAPLVMRPLRGEKKRFFDAVLPGSATGETWHTLWLTQVFGAELDVAGGAADIYGALFDVLEAVGLIRSLWMKTQENTRVYLLNPQTWFAARRLKRAVCPACGRWHTVSADEEAKALWSAMPCLSQGCLGGRHTIEPFDGETDLYAGRPRRAVSREHSGDVEGEERARIERSFIHGSEPWEVNLLSATPTLEMGIDIGDLSSVLLASVPPKVANYQQRVGRAGRRDGNALALTLAGTSAHARYFWADPEKMIAGEVDPPGVFLHATAVLERQLFALALTRWMTFYPAAELPKTIGAILKSQAVKTGRWLPESFPLGFLDYAKGSSETLLRDFALLFPAGFAAGQAGSSLFSAGEKERLRVFLTGDGEGTPSLRDRLLGKIESLGRARENALKRKEAYQQALKNRKKDPADEARENDIRELEENIRALSDLIADEYDKKQTLNVLTDEGLLPNYAFPEEGITIEGLVVSLRNRGAKPEAEPEEKEKPGADQKSQKTKKGGVYKRLTFQRAASSGLLEVAPENTFFTNDYVLHVDQVELADEGVRTWRFCPACQHSALEFSDEQSSACPRCGSAAWRDVSQRRQVLQLRSVYAWADVRDDRIRDDVESRRATRQVRKLLLDIAPDAARRSFTVEGGSGFAFEYLSSVTLRDFNFGPAGREEGDIEVAGEKLKAPGFEVCASCGRVKKKTGSRGRPQHDFHCKYFKDPDKAEWIDGLILFREFTSEALRIRLPGGELAAQYSTAEISASISAALTLGLRQYFHGSVDHLRLAEVEEPVRAGEGKRRSVVVYDTVPGGTGYLKELMDDPQKILGLFRMALEVMTACTCGGDPLARGCYRCVYQYGNQAQRESISKFCAMELVNDLLSKPVVETKPGLDEPPQGEVESELEAEFIRALRGSDLVTDMKRCQGGLPFYLIRMASGRLWRMDLQEDARGEAPSRPDFVLRPSREAERGPGLEMAVFTDGWRFHAGIVADDCAKRQSLLNRGTLVWTLTWDDIEAAREKASDIPGVPLFIRPLSPGSALSRVYEAWARQLKDRFGRGGCPTVAELSDVWGSAKKTSLDRLLLWMNDPEKASRAAEASAYVRALQCVLTDDRKPVAKGRIRLTGALAQALSATSDTKRHQFGVDRSEAGWSAVHDTTCRSAFFVDPDYFKAHEGEPASAQAARSLRAFWTAVNSAVLAERTVIVPSALPGGDTLQTPPWSRALDIGAASPARLFSKVSEAPAGEAFSERWEEAKALLPDMLQPLALALEKRGVPVEPENIGVEVPDKEGAVSVLYEFWWPEAKLAILFRPETAPEGVTALDAGGDPEETAREAARKLGSKGGAS